MTNFTELRRILLVGPRMASPAGEKSSDQFTWEALVAVAYQGIHRKDKSLVNSTLGLRVVLQDATTKKITLNIHNKNIDFLEPQLLTANLDTRKYLIHAPPLGLLKTIKPKLTFPYPNAKPYDLRAPVPDEDNPNKDRQIGGTFAVAVTPVDPWPTPQRSSEIIVPRFALAEHRMRVLVSFKDDLLEKLPFGFLNFWEILGNKDHVAAFVSSMDGVKDPRVLPRVELPIVPVTGPDAKDGPFVAIELTPHGIELHGTVANPMWAFEPGTEPERINVVLRLVHSVHPVNSRETIWSLELVREEGNNIRKALTIIRNRFQPESGKPIFLDINTDTDVPAVRWPLELIKTKNGRQCLSLPHKDNEDWQLWVDATALNSQLTGMPVRGGELPTTVKLQPNLLKIAAKKTESEVASVTVTLDIDRRDSRKEVSGFEKIIGPHVEITWTKGPEGKKSENAKKEAVAPSSKIAIHNDNGGDEDKNKNKKINWFLDQNALVRDLVVRYTKAGVQPPTANTTYAFLPISGGWLQLPFNMPDPEKLNEEVTSETQDLTVSDAIPFAGSFETVIPSTEDSKGPIGRRLTVNAADYVRAQAEFKGSQLTSITVEFRGAAGTADGILWMATGSPTPEEILPSLAAGPVSLFGPALQFQRGPKKNSALMGIESTRFTSSEGFEITLPTRVNDEKAYLWHGYSELPLVTAVPITRTALGSGLPSETRGLICRQIDLKSITIVLSNATNSSTPILKLLDKPESTTGKEPHTLPLLQSNALANIPLVAVTLAGIEMKPEQKVFSELSVNLSYGLPILDEYFANVRLPMTALAATSNTETPQTLQNSLPTSLDISALTESWQGMVDRLNLSRVQAAYAFESKQQKGDTVRIDNLFGCTTWETKFKLEPLVKIGEKEYAFGAYVLDNKNYSGEGALHGLEKAFKVGNATLTDADNADNSDSSLWVAGFAAAAWKQGNGGLWRDSRGALSAEIPNTMPFDGVENGLIFRENQIIRSDETIIAYRCATAAKPIPIEPPLGNNDRALAFWFRDLPLKKSVVDGRSQYVFESNDMELAIGPRQSAFDAEQLPQSLYEWRFCNNPANNTAGPSLYDIAIGPFCFRPLRLHGLTLKQNPVECTTTIIGSLTLIGDRMSSPESGPFGPEPDYQTGNLVAITMETKSNQLTFKNVVWRKASALVESESVALGGATELSFRHSDVSVCFGDDLPCSPNPDLNLTTISLTLTFNDLANDDGLPVFMSAKLETVLFGRRVTYEGGQVEYQKIRAEDTMSSIVATFMPEPKSDPDSRSNPTLPDDSGVFLKSVKLIWPVNRNPCMVLDGDLRLLAVDADVDKNAQPTKTEVVWHPLGESLWWLNLEIPKEYLTLCVNHRRGVIDIGVDWALSTCDTIQQPIAGLKADDPDIRATLMLVASEEIESDSLYRFKSKSGFGALNVISERGPIRRFDQVLVAEVLKDNTLLWTSRIEVDLELKEHQSRIHWPISSLPTKIDVPQKKEDPKIELQTLASNVSGHALTGKITPYDSTSVLKHTLSMKVTGQAVSIALLGISNKTATQKRRVAFAKPWIFNALVLHKLTTSDAAQKGMEWTTLDHVTLIDARQLLIDAKHAVNLEAPLTGESRDFAFAARYIVTDTEPKKNPSPVIKGGLVLRAFAQAGFPVEALAKHIIKDMFTGDRLNEDAVDDGIVITGAGVTAITTSDEQESPFWPAQSNKTPAYFNKDTQGVLLSLPWLTAVDSGYDFGPTANDGTNPPGKLAAFYQASNIKDLNWDAPDIDWAAGSPMPLSRRASSTESPGAGTAREIAELLERVRQGESESLTPELLERVRQGESQLPILVPVEQVFLQSKADDITQRPLWLRSLLALRTVYDAHNAHNVISASRVVMLVPVAKGRVARFRLTPTSQKDQSEQATVGFSGCLIAINHSTTNREQMRATEVEGGSEQAKHRARLVARAERLVKEPIAIVAVANGRKFGEKADTADTIWTRIEVPADLDDSIMDLPFTVISDRLYASPSLGWPTTKGINLAVSGALGLGPDFPFQDLLPSSKPVEGGKDVKSYGSGLSGRTASLSLPARAVNNSLPDGPDIYTRAPIFFGLGRKMIFDRPNSSDLPFVSPPARHLSPTEARVVVPLADELSKALSSVIQGKATPIVPPYLERVSFGLRPGAMQAEFDMLLFAPDLGGDEAMDDDFPRFGRPGHAAPRLLRQHRSPRAPALPRVPKDFVKSHGRRTYVEIDELDNDNQGSSTVKPFLLMEGVGTVLRRIVTDGEKEKFESFRIRVLDMPLMPEWTGELVLYFSSRSYSNGNDLAEVLAKMGILSAEATASLSIDGLVVPFSIAQRKSEAEGVFLTLRNTDITAARAQLDAVDGDSKVFLLFRCAPEGKSSGLTLASQRYFSIRLPVRPSARPSLPVNTSTLVFADPSYDRELSGTGAMDTLRDSKGTQWKLALDRFEYGTDTPIYFAFGPIDPKKGEFAENGVNTDFQVSFLHLPAKTDASSAQAPLKLKVDGLKDVDFPIKLGEAYAITFDRFRSANDGAVSFKNGDQIMISISPISSNEKPLTNGTQPINLNARVIIVSHPVIAPPAAVYALVVPENKEGKVGARVALHAAGPLPQCIDFPSLKKDLAVGHIRRTALFIWTANCLDTSGVDKSILVKIDRAGGGQVPEESSDMQSTIALPGIQSRQDQEI
ncbi:MAG: hypothetical protein JNL77_14045 [Nitrosomonas sp.]|nr:hypothetical protein [Nitrosomonas sp.]